MEHIRRRIYSLITVCLLFLVVKIGVAKGEWVISEVKVDGERQAGLDDVCFVDINNGWIVGSAYGDQRLILYTSDSGKTWQRQSKKSKWTQYLFVNRGVHCVDSQNVWIVGDRNLILHTSTGGLIWYPQISGLEPLAVMGVKRPIDLFDVHFTDKDNGWAVGFFGTIIHTGNGGLSWERQRSGTYEILWGIHCVDKNNCWITGGRGTILHTTNGGKKRLGFLGGWKKQASGTEADLYGVHFVDKDNGWICGVGGISHTSNGGKTWQTQARFDKTVLYKVFFVDKNNGWAVGADIKSDTSVIKYTTDGGKTWSSQSIGKLGLRSIYFIDKNTGWIIGGDGTILRYIGDNGAGK